MAVDNDAIKEGLTGNKKERDREEEELIELGKQTLLEDGPGMPSISEAAAKKTGMPYVPSKATLPTTLRPTFYRVEDIPEESGGGKKLTRTTFRDQEGKAPKGAPLLSPTIMADLKGQGLQSIIPSLRAELQRGLVQTRGQNEITKLQSLIDRLESDAEFERKVRSSHAASQAQGEDASLSEDAQRRMGSALEILDLARDKGLVGEGGSKGALSEAIKATLVSQVEVGPRGKSRIYLTQLPGGNKPVMDIPRTHSNLRQRYFQQYVRNNKNPDMPVSDTIRAEAEKYAAEKAAKDIVGISARFQGIPFLDPRNPETVEELVEGPYTALRAHLRTRTTTDIFAPTMEEIKRSGGIWEFFRKISPLEYAAPQAKLLREHLEEEAPNLAPLLTLNLGPFSPVNAMVLTAGIFGQSERLLNSVGYTPDQMVNEYLDGHLWLDEASENYSLLTKASFLLQGYTEEEAELERQRAKKSKINKISSFATYFADPDIITVGLASAGPIAKGLTAAHFKNALTRGLDVAEDAAINADTAQEAIDAIKRTDPALATLMEASIAMDAGIPVSGFGNVTPVAQAEEALKTTQQSLQTAATDVGDDVEEFIRRFIVDGESPEITPEFLQSISAVRANSSTREAKELLKNLERTYADALSAASANINKTEEVDKLIVSAEAKLKELAPAITVRKRAERDIEEAADEILTLLSGIASIPGKDAAKQSRAVREYWFLERRIAQLEMGLSQAKKIRKMSDIPIRVREQIILQHLSAGVVRDIRQKVAAGKSLKDAAKEVGISESTARTLNESGTWGTAALGNIRATATVDSLSDKELFVIAKRLKLPETPNTDEGRALLRELIRKHARVMRRPQLENRLSNLESQLQRLRSNRQRVERAVTRSGGNLEEIRGLREKLNGAVRTYRKASRIVPEGTENVLAAYRARLRTLRTQRNTFASRAESAIRESARAFSTHGVLRGKREKIRITDRIKGKAGKKIINLASNILKVGQDGPGPFTLSARDAESIAKKLTVLIKNQKSFEEAAQALDISQRTAKWRETLTDAVANVRRGKDNLTQREIWEAAVLQIRKAPTGETEPLQAVLNSYIRPTEDGAEVFLDYQRGGKSIVTAFQEAGVSPGRLQDALERSGEIGLQLQKAIDSQSSIQLSKGLLEEANLLPAILQATRISERGAETAALLAIRTRANLPINSSQNVLRILASKTFSGLAGIIRWVGRPGDLAMTQRLGITTEQETQALRAGEQMMNQMAYEMQTLIRLHKVGDDTKEFFRVLGLYLDSTTPMPLQRQAGKVTAYTVMNASPKSLFQNMKAHVTNFHMMFSKEELADAAKQSVNHTKNMDGAPKAFSPVALAFSRVWLGDTVPNGGQAAFLYREAVRVLSDPKFSTFQSAVDEMRNITKRAPRKADPNDPNSPIISGGLGRDAALDGRKGRVYGFAANAVVQGAMLEKMMPTLRALSGGILTPSQVEGANALMGATGAALASLDNLDDAVNTLWQIGGALTVDRVFQTGIKEDASKLKTLFRIGTNPTGNDVFVTGALRNELMASLDGKIKELHKISEKQPNALARATRLVVDRLLPFWKQSATMGAYIPNAGYTTYVRVGDMSQLFLTSGVRFTARTQLQNVWSDIPFFGTAFQNHLTRQTAKTGKPGLRSVFETTFSPHFSDFFSGKDGFFRLPNGDVVSFSGLREKAVREGMVDVFPSAELEEGLRTAGATHFDALFGGRSVADTIMDNEWNRMIKDHATQTQLRQRVGTWLLHVKDGKSPEEAAKLVRESLYDWTHGVGKFEQRFMASWMPFWRYWRLATSQTYEAFLRPFMDPSTGKWLEKGMLGDTRVNRLRTLGRTQTDSERVLSDPRSIEDTVREDGYSAAFGRVMTPSFFGRQVQLYNRANDPEMQRKLAELQRPGKQLLQTAGVLPPIHGIDHLEMMMLPFIGMSAVALAAVGEETAAHHLWETTKTGVLDKLSPWYRDMLEESYTKSGQDLAYIRPVQAAMLEMIPVVEVQLDPETGRKYTSKFNKKVIDYLPVIGTEIPRFLDAAHFKNPNNRDEWQKGLSRFFLEYTRIVREYSYDPQVEYNLRMQKALTKYQEDTKRAGYLIEKPE